jgi:hypothetical protein
LNFPFPSPTIPLGRRPRPDDEDRSDLALGHHFWIRKKPAADSPEAFVTPILRARGVRAIDIDEWGRPFAALLSDLFPA